MSLPCLFTASRTMSILWLMLIAVMLLSLSQGMAYGFQDDQFLLADWRPAHLGSEKLSIYHRVRVYQQPTETAFEDEQSGQQPASSYNETDIAGWPGFAGVGKSSSVKLSYGGLTDEDDQDNHRPPFMPGLAGSDFSLTLLPVLRLAADWQKYLPGTHWLHWLTGEPDYDSGVTVIVRFGNHPPIVVQVMPEEYQHMAEYLANPQALLYWLVPRIQGRDALVNQLLALMDTMTMEVNEPAKEAMENQLADILDQPGILVDVELERFSLQRTLENFIEFPERKSHQQTQSLGTGGAQEGEKSSTTGNSQTPGKPNTQDSDTGRENNHSQPPEQPSGGQPGETEPAQEESPYFTLKMNGREYRIARKQLDPEKRGQENAAEVYAYEPGKLTDTRPLTELEQMAGVQQFFRLPDTDQKPLNYLTLYGTEETRQALQEFYPVDVLQITSDNHLEAASGLTGEQLGKDCIICQDSMHRYRASARTDCQHIFHLPCLITFFSERPRDESGEINLTCPYCRRKQTQLGQLLNSPTELSQELLQASEQGDEAVVRALLEARVSSDAVDTQSRTALHKAALANNLGIVVLLISGGASVDQTDSQGLTAIDLASMSGHRPMVETLSETIGVAPVFYWAAYGFTDEIEKWIQRGEDVQGTRNREGATLLHIAAARGHTEIAEQLLNYAESLNLEVIDCLNNRHQTPLCAACDNGETAMVRLLLNRGASSAPQLPVEADSPLFLSARKGCLEIVQLLLADQAENDQDNERINALLVAARHGHSETVRELMAGIHTPLDQWGEQALLEAARQGHWRVVGMLLDAGVSGSVSQKKALGLAAEGRHVKTVQLLLERGALSDSNDNALAFTLLLESVEKNQPEMVRLLLKYGAPINQTRKGDEVTALIRAADHGWLDVVKALLEQGANVNQATKWYFGAKTYTPLKLAVMNGRNEIVKVLLESGAKITSDLALPQVAVLNYQLFDAVLQRNIRKVKTLLPKHDNLNTGNALYYAARRGLIQTAKLLLKHKADPNYTRLTEGDTPLHGAAQGGHLNLIRLLLDNKADATIGNTHGESPLDIASSSGNIETVALLSAAMQKASSGELKNVLALDVGNALYHGAASGQYESVKWLLNNKADPNSADESSGGMTPLHIAARNNHGDIIRLLLAHGADHHKANNEGETPLDIARQFHQQAAEAELTRVDQGRSLLEAVEQGNIEQANTLLESGADPDYQNSQGKTALHFAVSAGQIDLVRLLLQYTNRPDLSDGHYTALHLAAISGFTEIAGSLLDAGASPARYTTEDELPLHLAARGNHQAMVHLLSVNPQVDINGVSGEQRTALHIAAQAGFPDMVSLLLTLGAEPRLKDREGNTLLHVVCRVFSKEQLKSFFSEQHDLRRQLFRESDTNNSGETPLAVLSSRGDIDEESREALVQRLKDQPARLSVSGSSAL